MKVPHFCFMSIRPPKKVTCQIFHFSMSICIGAVFVWRSGWGWGKVLSRTVASSIELCSICSFCSSQKLCCAQQVVIVDGAKVKWKSLCLSRTLHLEFNLTKEIFTAVLAELRWMLKDSCSGVMAGDYR